MDGLVYSVMSIVARVSYRIFHWEGNMSQSYDKTMPFLGGVWGHAPPGNFRNLRPLRLHFRPILTELSIDNLYLLCHDFECLVSW